MSFMFGSPKLPEIRTITPPAITATVPTTEKDIEAVKQEEKKKLTEGRKKRSTILTSPQGIMTPANVGLKTLLGE